MKKNALRKYKLPDTAGVYLFKKGKEILYVGKATSLRSRVFSYFGKNLDKQRGRRLVEMISFAKSLSYKKTDNVFEAIILEASLIKKHQPYYNTREKDDRSFLYVTITKDIFPKVLLTRKKGDYGPFTDASAIRAGLKIVRKIFPFRDRCSPDGRACFQSQIGLCPGVCSGNISQKEYRVNIRNINLFFAGKKLTLVSKLEMEMKRRAMDCRFEEAAQIRNQIFALKHINDIALIKRDISKINCRIEAYDISHMSGKATVGAMAVIRDGHPEKSGYRMFRMRKKTGGNDVMALSELLSRRFRHSAWPRPDLIVVDGGQAQVNVARSYKIPVVGVVKDNKHRPAKLLGASEFIRPYEQAILLANSEAHRFAVAYHRKIR